MSGERATTSWQRLGGRICAICKASLPPPHTPGERRCAKCGGKRRVYMHFMLQNSWFCQFLEEDLKTPLPRKLTLRDPAKIVEIAERGEAMKNLEERQAVEYAISTGRGGVWLNLTEEQYQKLCVVGERRTGIV